MHTVPVPDGTDIHFDEALDQSGGFSALSPSRTAPKPHGRSIRKRDYEDELNRLDFYDDYSR